MDTGKTYTRCVGKPEFLKKMKYTDAVKNVIEKVDKGELRTAEPLVMAGR